MCRITIICEEERPLKPLLQAYDQKGVAVRLIAAATPNHDALQCYGSEADALLVIGSRRRSPHTALPGPVLWRNDGTAIPLGWLPYIGAEALGTFAKAAARVHGREGAMQPVAILSQRLPRYLRLASRIGTLLRRQGMPVFHWTGDVVFREDMARGLRTGLAAAVYVGHGRPIGWVGYYGLRIHHFEEVSGEPLGALLSLCCRTASRRRTGLSFSEAVPLRGIAAAAFGAVTDTLHLNNTRWAVSLCTALQQGARTIGDLIVQGLPPNPQAVADYRLIGDPLAPLLGTERALVEADAIPVYG